MADGIYLGVWRVKGMLFEIVISNRNLKFLWNFGLKLVECFYYNKYANITFG